MNVVNAVRIPADVVDQKMSLEVVDQGLGFVLSGPDPAISSKLDFSGAKGRDFCVKHASRTRKRAERNITTTSSTPSVTFQVLSNRGTVP